MQPDTRYAKSGDVHVAYQVFGEGPLNLVFAPFFVSNIEVWLGLSRCCSLAASSGKFRAGGGV